jgi:mercuric ion transport protein
LPDARTQKATLVGSALAAILASTCCLGPLVLVALGFSGAWIGNLTALEPYRPIFIAAALVAMALAWRRIYRVAAAEGCAPETACALPRANRIYRIVFWLVGVLVLLAIAFPFIVPFFY